MFVTVKRKDVAGNGFISLLAMVSGRCVPVQTAFTFFLSYPVRRGVQQGTLLTDTHMNYEGLYYYKQFMCILYV